jgi:uncharacterized protein YndB with AHSA1/START domain
MSTSYWHRFYTATIAAPPEQVFDLLSDLPNYREWLPASTQYASTTDVDPYPVQLGSRYHDGRPGERGKDWWGTVTGFQRSGSLDFHHLIHVRPLRATVDVHIHYSLEPAGSATTVTRWLVLDVTMPPALRPLRRAIIAAFDTENLRTMDALKAHAEDRAEVQRSQQVEDQGRSG